MGTFWLQGVVDIPDIFSENRASVFSGRFYMDLGWVGWEERNGSEEDFIAIITIQLA